MDNFKFTFNTDKEMYDHFIKIGYEEKEATVLSTLIINCLDYEYGREHNTHLLKALFKEYEKQKEYSFIDFIYKSITDKKFLYSRKQIIKTINELKTKEEKIRKMYEDDDDSFFSKITNFLHIGGPVSKNTGIRGSNARYLITPNEAQINAMKQSSRAGYAPEMINCTQESIVLPNMSPSISVSNASEIMENIRYDSYEKIEPNRFLSVTTSPTSTFRATYNTAAMSNLINNIKLNGRISTSMIRTEEMLNFLNYSLKKPENNQLFNVTIEQKQTKEGNDLLMFGIKGKNIIPQKQNITFLLDVSGSMSSNTKAMQVAFFTILKMMSEDSSLSLVTYSDKDEVVFVNKKLNNKSDIQDIIINFTKLIIDGCTYGSAGINKAYDIAKSLYIDGAVNRVILMTDGDLNFGITNKDGLEGLIKEKKDNGIFLSVIGTGTYNLQDDKLEVLAKNGNGNYCVVNSVFDTYKNLVERFESFMHPIATDVKIQVEFNPKFIEKYKLAGYENRMLNHEDFRDDTVISEPFGSGSFAVALYEIIKNKNNEVKNEYKYQTSKIKDSDELATISIRYKTINDNTVKEETFIVSNDTINKTIDNVNKAEKCYIIAEKLRKENDSADIETLNEILKLL